MRRLAALASLLLAASGVAAQEHETVRRAQTAYDELDFLGAISAAESALQGSLSREDRLLAYELLGYAYGAMDSTRQSVDAFRQLIFLDPDREPDVERVSPRITSLYAFALGQVLVVRRLRVDSSTFIAGQGSAPVRFEVSRAAKTQSRIIGPGVDMIVDTQTVAGGLATRFDWTLTGPSGTPLPAGEYQLITTAFEGQHGEFSSSPLSLRIAHAERDTLPMLTSLPGYEEQPELVSPPRDYRPLLLSVLYTGIGAGAFFVVERGQLGTGPRTALVSLSGAAIATGLVMSLRKPEPRPSQANILYNQLLRELLSRQNADIARENAARRTQVMVTVRAAP